MDRGKIIIIEGTSCVGKTTLCTALKQDGWVVIPEAIRYLEHETQKIGDDASPIPNEQLEEEYYQSQLFRIELQKIREANYYSNLGYNVVIDKSAIATIATAKAFEESKGFHGTFFSACSKYNTMLKQIEEDNIIECDGFILLTTNYNEIRQRNITRKHVLDGIWLAETTINSQRNVLEIFTNNIIGKFSKNEIVTKVLDTTFLSQNEVLNSFISFANSIEINQKRKVRKIND